MSYSCLNVCNVHLLYYSARSLVSRWCTYLWLRMAAVAARHPQMPAQEPGPAQSRPAAARMLASANPAANLQLCVLLSRLMEDGKAKRAPLNLHLLEVCLQAASLHTASHVPLHAITGYSNPDVGAAFTLYNRLL